MLNKVLGFVRRVFELTYKARQNAGQELLPHITIKRQPVLALPPRQEIITPITGSNIKVGNKTRVLTDKSKAGLRFSPHQILHAARDFLFFAAWNRNLQLSS